MVPMVVAGKWDKKQTHLNQEQQQQQQQQQQQLQQQLQQQQQQKCQQQYTDNKLQRNVNSWVCVCKFWWPDTTAKLCDSNNEERMADSKTGREERMEECSPLTDVSIRSDQ